MVWNNTEYNGFLPANDPLCKIYGTTTSSLYDYFFCLEFLASNLPSYLEERRWREEVISVLRHTNAVLPARSNLDYEKIIERMMLLYSYFASAYIYANYETPATRLPKEISSPLLSLSKILDRKPILSYASYCLYNWKRKSQDVDITVDNIELLQNFSLNNKQDEDWFILIHVDIEAKAQQAIKAISDVIKGRTTVLQGMPNILNSLIKMNETLARMPEKCNPDNYFNKVRPYIFGFENVVYESSKEVMTLRGETGAQSSIMPTLLAYFEIKHADSMLTEHLKIMRDYMPAHHRAFIESVENKSFSIRELCQQDKSLKEFYNLCLKEIIVFRKKHFEYAIDYIQAKVKNPKGTGGTPYVEWLGKLILETESQYIE